MALRVTVFPFTVQTLVVVEANITASPEVAVALRVGEEPSVWVPIGPNVITLAPCVTVKLWLMGVAAA